MYFSISYCINALNILIVHAFSMKFPVLQKYKYSTLLQLDRSTRVLLESFIPVCCLIAYFFLLLFYYVAIFVLNSSFPFPKAAHKAILALVVVVMMACMLTVLVVLTESLTYPFSFSFVLWLPSLNLLCSPWQQSLIQISYLQVSLLLQRCGSRRRSWLFGCYYSYLSWYSCMHLSPLCLLDRSPISLLSSRTPRRQNGNLSVFILVSELSSLFLPSLSVNSRSMAVLFPSIRPCGLLLSSS